MGLSVALVVVGSVPWKASADLVLDVLMVALNLVDVDPEKSVAFFVAA